jgi:hypothetical protein
MASPRDVDPPLRAAAPDQVDKNRSGQQGSRQKGKTDRDHDAEGQGDQEEGCSAENTDVSVAGLPVHDLTLSAQVEQDESRRSSEPNSGDHERDMVGKKGAPGPEQLPGSDEECGTNGGETKDEAGDCHGAKTESRTEIATESEKTIGDQDEDTDRLAWKLHLAQSDLAGNQCVFPQASAAAPRPTRIAASEEWSSESPVQALKIAKLAPAPTIPLAITVPPWSIALTLSAGENQAKADNKQCRASDDVGDLPIVTEWRAAHEVTHAEIEKRDRHIDSECAEAQLVHRARLGGRTTSIPQVGLRR